LIPAQNVLFQQFLNGGCFLSPRKHINKVMPIPEELLFEDWWFAFHFTRLGLIEAIDNIVTLYRIHSHNDIGVLNITYDAIRKDNLRRFDYLYKFKPYIKSKIEAQYWERALAILDSFFGKKRFDNLLQKPFDRSWIKVFLYSIFGAKSVHKFKGFSKYI